MIKYIICFKSGATIALEATDLGVRDDVVKLYGKDGRVFACFYKESIAGWIREDGE